MHLRDDDDPIGQSEDACKNYRQHRDPVVVQSDLIIVDGKPIVVEGEPIVGVQGVPAIIATKWRCQCRIFSLLDDDEESQVVT